MSQRLLLFLAVILTAAAQPAGRPVFEVASVKPSLSAAPASLTSDPGMWSCLNCRLFDLFGYAYKTFEYQLIAPDWTKADRFDVQAKLPPGLKPAPFSTPVEADEFALMMQSLLEERFQMKVHRENRKIPVYELQIARGGHKMQEVSQPAPPPPPGPSIDKDGFPVVPGGDGMRLLHDRGRIQFRAQSMFHLAHFISTQIDRPVVDTTGLTGRYALTLSWYRAADDSPAGPDIFAAVQQQLGLKLQPAQGLVEMVVIDRISKTAIAN